MFVISSPCSVHAAAAAAVKAPNRPSAVTLGYRMHRCGWIGLDVTYITAVVQRSFMRTFYFSI